MQVGPESDPNGVFLAVSIVWIYIFTQNAKCVNKETAIALLEAVAKRSVLIAAGENVDQHYFIEQRLVSIAN